ncbi:BTAD domain-containing putative transcriptional regulator [Planomonospora sp. ID82291]|uniref:AfsR/SARP family transcriptional regulator n=1 Tax=Planomonospora sp. ID82291 TaxID=2738136 RepID=UPI0018C414CF|nr:BTAD domain-containing putative transcriptional regulator [Planomonospora sp. ID82291]MBG0816728.1 tetratricopeptide repeat protein [Planomonospora sp. ID82291]
MQFEILGPLRVRSGDTVPVLGPPKQRLFLAVLLGHPHGFLSVDRLVDALWGPAPPPSAEANLRLYARGLRLVLGTGRILREGHAGYRIDACCDEVDACRFVGLVQDGQAALAADDAAGARRSLGEALELWQGPPFSDLSGEFALREERSRLEEWHMVAIEQRIRADLCLGQDAALVAELTALVNRHAFRERLWSHLMLALYRSGRQAEALETYRRARAILADELGLEPSPELRSMERAILTADPRLWNTTGPRLWDTGEDRPPGTDDRATRARPPASGHRAVPAQLPASPLGFVGRDGELARLDGIAADAGEEARVAAVVGPPGVGKTALAVRWAHRARHLFGDGQFFVDLGGFGVGGPLDPGLVLERFLRALDVPPWGIPADTEERAAVFRSRMSGRRMLIVLDNAASAAQVRALLPGGAPSLTLITSRLRLDGLATTHGVPRVPLGPLPVADAVALIRDRLAPAGHATGVEELAELCDRIPLALRIAASRLEMPAYEEALPALVAEMADERVRLDRLAVDENEISVRAVLHASLRPLDEPVRAMFRLLGLHPGPEPSLAVAAVMSGRPAGETRDLLDRLVSVHLLAPVPGDHYTMHDLVRIYARERFLAEEGADERERCTTALLTWYRDVANAADRVLRPKERPNFVSPAPPAGFTDDASALAWFDAEAANLDAAVRRAAESHPALAWQIAAAMFGWLHRRHHTGQWADLYTVAAEAAATAGDPVGEAMVTGRLAIAHSLLGDTERAVSACHRAHRLRLGLGDTLGAATALLNLAAAYINARRPQEAIRWLEEAGALGARLPDAHHFTALLHSNLGEADHLAGRLTRAMSHYRTSLRISETGCGDRDIAQILVSMSALHRDMDAVGEAVSCGERALALAVRAGDTSLRADAHEALGLAHAALGHDGEALVHLESALALFEDLRHRKTGVVRDHLDRLGAARGR